MDLISFTATDFEIQLVFRNTDYISASATELDIIEVRFKKNDLFVDAETFEVKARLSKVRFKLTLFLRTRTPIKFKESVTLSYLELSKEN